MVVEEVIYLIDADCIIGLQNSHDDGHAQTPPTSYQYPSHEQAAIWSALADLADVGRPKVLPEVVSEVGRKTLEGQTLLKALRHTRVTRTRAIMEKYQEIVANHVRWQTDPDGEDPADAWLISTAGVNGFQILTDERPAATQSRSRAGKPKIPDVAANHGVVTKIGLRQLAKEQGWIP